MRRLIPYLVLAGLAAVACNPSSPSSGEIDTGTGLPTCKATTAPTGKTASVSLADPPGQAPPQVTFYGDLLPILDSSSPGAAYKCTTCHANFKTPDSMNNVGMITTIISDMTQGKMPRPGDLVPKDKIALFTAWQLQGFNAGTPGQAPSNFDVSSLAGTTPSGAAAKSAPCTPAGKS